MAGPGWLVLPTLWLLVLAFTQAVAVPFPSGRQEPHP